MPTEQQLAWNEVEALAIADAVNKKVAGIFCQQVKQATFQFVDHLELRPSEAKGKGANLHLEVLGRCTMPIGLIQIVKRNKWSKTLIHELVHLYNPGMPEKKVRQVTDDVGRYFIAIRNWGL